MPVLVPPLFPQQSKGFAIQHSCTIADAFSIFAVAILLLPGCQELSQPESTPHIHFEYLVQRGSAAEEIREAHSRDGKVVLKVEGPKWNGFVRLYETTTNQPKGPEISLAGSGVSYRLTALAIDLDNSTVAAAIGNFSNDWGEVTVWDATNGNRIAKYVGPPYLGEVFDVSFKANGTVVVITSGPAGGM